MADTALNIAMHSLRRTLLRPSERGRTDAELLEAFVARRNETSFEAILDRHGPMVLGLCRRILRNEADAEDAYQATFLVLVRKAASIRPRGMLGNWLYGVANTTALKALAMKSKRSAKERAAAARPKIRAPETSQLLHLLDRELNTLPDIYRAAIVLCDLEGKSIKEAAQQLGCPQGTMASRVGRGRTMLARRLAHHGVAFSGAVLASTLARQATAAAVSPVLLKSTVDAAMLFATGHGMAIGALSSTVVALSEGVLKTMLIGKLKFATATVMTVMLGTSATIGVAPNLGTTFAFAPTAHNERPASPPADGRMRPRNGPAPVDQAHAPLSTPRPFIMKPQSSLGLQTKLVPKRTPNNEEVVDRASKSKVAAWVNGQPIFKDEILLQIQLGKTEFDGALRQTIELEIAYQDAVQKLKKGNPQVLAKLKEIANSEFEKQSQAIRKTMPDDQFRALAPAFRRQIERQLIGMEYVRSRTFSEVNKIGNQEAKEYYDAHQGEFPMFDETVQLKIRIKLRNQVFESEYNRIIRELKARTVVEIERDN